MSLLFTEEMLSAYLDGEASPAECELVERLLAEKQEVRDLLAGLSENSLALRALANETAPPGFADAVLNQININFSQVSSQVQQVSAPEVITSSASPPETSIEMNRPAARATTLFSRNWGNSRIWVGALVTSSVLTASLLLLFLPLRFGFEETSSVATLYGDRNVPNFEMGEALSRNHPSDDFIVVNNSLPAPIEVRLMESTTVPNFSNNLMFAYLPKTDSLEREALTKQLNSLGDVPRSGDEFSMLTDLDQSPILVDFTVIDVQKSLGTLQVLLKKHAIEQVQLTQDDSRKKTESQDGLVAVYLDLEEPQLEDVLNQLVAVQATVFVEEFDSTSNFGENNERDESDRFSLAGKANKWSVLGLGVEPGATATTFGLDSKDSGSLPAVASPTPKATGLATNALSDPVTKEEILAETSTTPASPTERQLAQKSEQQFRFDMESVRSSSLAQNSLKRAREASPGRFLAPDDNRVVVSGTATEEKPVRDLKRFQGGAMMPPAPSLPESLTVTVEDRLPSATASRQDDAKSNRRMQEEKAPDGVSGSVPSASRKNQLAPNKDEPAPTEAPKRVRAFLILREEREGLPQ